MITAIVTLVLGQLPNTKLNLRPDAAKLIRVSRRGVQVPAEITMAMGLLAIVVAKHRQNRRSKFHKAAMLVDCIAYDVLDPKKMGWIAIHFKQSYRHITALTQFRNMIQKYFRWSNKTYDWSGLMLSSNVPGCTSRIALGPGSSRRGLKAFPHATGGSYFQAITNKF